MKKSLLGINLESLYYYSRGLMYADAMKQAQGMFQQTPSNYATFRKDGQPPADCCPLIATGMTPAFAGTYQFRCNGQPQLAIKAASSKITITGQTYNATMDSTAALINIPVAAIAELNQWALQIHNVVPGKVRNVQLFRPGAKPTDRFYTPFAQMLSPFSVVRFMDALKTNGWGTNPDKSPRANPIVNWSDRMLPTDLNYGDLPMPYEDMFDFCTLIGKDSWGCIPQSATDDHINQYVLLAKAKLAGTAHAHYCGLSNETWNFNMPQYKVTMALSQADPDPTLSAGGADINIRRYRWMAKQVVKIAKAAMAAYGVKSIRDCPIRPVLDGQWANPQILKYGLQWIDTNVGDVADYLYGIAIAPYAGLSSAVLAGIATATPQQILAGFQVANASDAATTGAHLTLAHQYDIHLMAYECGFDAGQGDPGLTNKNAAAYLPAIRQLVKTYLQKWQSVGGGLACWFTSTSMYTKWGQWGLTEDLAVLTSPKYQGAVDASATLSWDDAPLGESSPIPPPITPPDPASPVQLGKQMLTMNGGKVAVSVTLTLYQGAQPGAALQFSAGPAGSPGTPYSITITEGSVTQTP